MGLVCVCRPDIQTDENVLEVAACGAPRWRVRAFEEMRTKEFIRSQSIDWIWGTTYFSTQVCVCVPGASTTAKYT